MEYTVLALNGGGMRGVLQIGALQALSEEKNEKFLYNVFTGGVYGISMGALIATLIAFEFSVDDLSLLTELLGNMQDAFQPLRLQTLLGLTQTNGIDDGSKIFTLLDTEFKKRGLEFKDLRIGDAAIPLHIVASNLTTLNVTVFRPSIRVWDALRASFSIPYIFKPHIIQSQLFVDGAVLCRRIVETIPNDDRAKSLLLLTAYTKEITIDNYLSAVPFSRNIKDTHSMKEMYPKNACLLIENGAQMFTFWDSADLVRHLLSVGRTAYHNFRTESLDEELPQDSDLRGAEILEGLG